MAGRGRAFVLGRHGAHAPSDDSESGSEESSTEESGSGSGSGSGSESGSGADSRASSTVSRARKGRARGDGSGMAAGTVKSRWLAAVQLQGVDADKAAEQAAAAAAAAEATGQSIASITAERERARKSLWNTVARVGRRRSVGDVPPSRKGLQGTRAALEARPSGGGDEGFLHDLTMEMADRVDNAVPRATFEAGMKDKVGTTEFKVAIRRTAKDARDALYAEVSKLREMVTEGLGQRASVTDYNKLLQRVIKLDNVLDIMKTDMMVFERKLEIRREDADRHGLGRPAPAVAVAAAPIDFEKELSRSPSMAAMASAQQHNADRAAGELADVRKQIAGFETRMEDELSLKADAKDVEVLAKQAEEALAGVQANARGITSVNAKLSAAVDAIDESLAKTRKDLEKSISKVRKVAEKGAKLEPRVEALEALGAKLKKATDPLDKKFRGIRDDFFDVREQMAEQARRHGELLDVVAATRNDVEENKAGLHQADAGVERNRVAIENLGTELGRSADKLRSELAAAMLDVQQDAATAKEEALALRSSTDARDAAIEAAYRRMRNDMHTFENAVWSKVKGLHTGKIAAELEARARDIDALRGPLAQELSNALASHASVAAELQRQMRVHRELLAAIQTATAKASIGRVKPSTALDEIGDAAQRAIALSMATGRAEGTHQLSRRGRRGSRELAAEFRDVTDPADVGSGPASVTLWMPPGPRAQVSAGGVPEFSEGIVPDSPLFGAYAAMRASDTGGFDGGQPTPAFGGASLPAAPPAAPGAAYSGVKWWAARGPTAVSVNAAVPGPSETAGASATPQVAAQVAGHGPRRPRHAHPSRRIVIAPRGTMAAGPGATMGIWSTETGEAPGSVSTHGGDWVVEASAAPSRHGGAVQASAILQRARQPSEPAHWTAAATADDSEDADASAISVPGMPFARHADGRSIGEASPLSSAPSSPATPANAHAAAAPMPFVDSPSSVAVAAEAADGEASTAQADPVASPPAVGPREPQTAASHGEAHTWKPTVAAHTLMQTAGAAPKLRPASAAADNPGPGRQLTPVEEDARDE